jgi:Predicted membrane protein
MQLKLIGVSLKETFKAWNDRDPFASSAVLAYYTIFSLPGLLVIVVNIAGYFWGREAVTNEITGQVGGMIGKETAGYIQNIIANASISKGTIISSILGIATLIFGATGVFYHVQQIFNKIWEVKPKPKTKQKILQLLRDRLFSFGLILVIGFLLLVSLVLSAVLQSLSNWVARHLSSSLLIVFNIADLLISVGIITFLFAAMYKYLPDAKIQWRDVWVGALISTILFVIAKYALGLYFGTSKPGSAYGAAGSIILIMLWVSYSGLILMFGAEFTRIFAKKKGRYIPPQEIAEKDRANEGFGSKKKA